MPAMAAGPPTGPVPAAGGERGSGEHAMRQVADDVTGAVDPGAGHFPPEEAPGWTARTLVGLFARRPATQEGQEQ